MTWNINAGDSDDCVGDVGILNMILLLVEDEMVVFTTKATRMIFIITIILYMATVSRHRYLKDLDICTHIWPKMGTFFVSLSLILNVINSFTCDAGMPLCVVFWFVKRRSSHIILCVSTFQGKRNLQTWPLIWFLRWATFSNFCHYFLAVILGIFCSLWNGGTFKPTFFSLLSICWRQLSLHLCYWSNPYYHLGECRTVLATGDKATTWIVIRLNFRNGD